MNKPYMDEEILKDLQSRYQKATLTKKELANELNMGLSSINNYITKGFGIPDYIKLSDSKNSKVVFSLISITEYLSSHTVKVA